MGDKKEIKTMNKTVAKTIFNQLGGDRFLVMTGSSSVIIENGLLLKLKITRVAKYLEIVLNGNDMFGNDMYDLTFFNLDRKSGQKKIKEQIMDVYAEQLVEIFENYTKLRTRL
jgi:hypothetical protein